jgi:hypothetical protein
VELELELLADRLDRARRIDARTLKQIVCSDEACEIRTTLTAGRGERAEDAAGDAGHADHARPRSVSSADRRPT